MGFVLVDRKLNTPGVLLPQQWLGTGNMSSHTLSIYAAACKENDLIDAQQPLEPLLLRVSLRQTAISFSAHVGCEKPLRLQIHKNEEIWVSCDTRCVVWSVVEHLY